jgi:hypothetical protein
MFHLAEVSNSIILCLSGILDSGYSTVFKYDHSLNDLCEMELDFNAISMNVYKNNIFFLSGISQRHSNCHIYVYDEHFNLIDILGQDTDFYIPFFLPEIISSVQVSEDYFVLLDNIEENQISIMDKNAGEWDFSIRLNKSSKFFLNQNSNHILIFDGAFEKLNLHEFDPECGDHNIKLKKDGILSGLNLGDLVDCTYDKLIFFNQHEKILFF